MSLPDSTWAVVFAELEPYEGTSRPLKAARLWRHIGGTQPLGIAPKPKYETHFRVNLARDSVLLYMRLEEHGQPHRKAAVLPAGGRHRFQFSIHQLVAREVGRNGNAQDVVCGVDRHGFRGHDVMFTLLVEMLPRLVAVKSSREVQLAVRTGAIP